jgi:hypothetical protein
VELVLLLLLERLVLDLVRVALQDELAVGRLDGGGICVLWDAERGVGIRRELEIHGDVTAVVVGRLKRRRREWRRRWRSLAEVKSAGC